MSLLITHSSSHYKHITLELTYSTHTICTSNTIFAVAELSRTACFPFIPQLLSSLVGFQVRHHRVLQQSAPTECSGCAKTASCYSQRLTPHFIPSQHSKIKWQKRELVISYTICLFNVMRNTTVLALFNLLATTIEELD